MKGAQIRKPASAWHGQFGILKEKIQEIRKIRRFRLVQGESCPLNQIDLNNWSSQITQGTCKCFLTRNVHPVSLIKETYEIKRAPYAILNVLVQKFNPG
jgi:hypothetical protein